MMFCRPLLTMGARRGQARPWVWDALLGGLGGRAGLCLWLFLVSGVHEAAAFRCTQTDQGASLAWSRRDVVIRPSVSPAEEVSEADVAAALTHAAAQWSDAPCSDFAFRVEASTEERWVGFDWAAGTGSSENRNIVVFRNDIAGDPQDQWLHAGSALAITTVTFVRSTGRIVDADIEINDARFVFSNCDAADCSTVHDLKNMLTHELGHVLGLDHPPASEPDAAAATMYASAQAGDISKRDLAADDVAGLCTLYPAGEGPGECGIATLPPPPSVVVETAGCGTAPGRTARPWSAALLCVLLFHCGRNAARRKPLRATLP
ncbi:MAG: matrixin family metalloprotease [Myxococcota bacterium]